MLESYIATLPGSSTTDKTLNHKVEDDSGGSQNYFDDFTFQPSIMIDYSAMRTTFIAREAWPLINCQVPHIYNLLEGDCFHSKFNVAIATSPEPGDLKHNMPNCLHICRYLQ